MGALTEVEIFDCMADNLRKAIQHCEDLAVKPRKGVSYILLREELKLIEGCCRQASVWREDTRWLQVGLDMEKAHVLAQDWLRGIVDPETGRRRLLPEGVKHPLFMKLKENLASLLASTEKMKTARVNRIGAILPLMREGPHRQVRGAYGVKLPGGIEQRPSGLIVPAGIV